MKKKLLVLSMSLLFVLSTGSQIFAQTRDSRTEQKSKAAEIREEAGNQQRPRGNNQQQRYGTDRTR